MLDISFIVSLNTTAIVAYRIKICYLIFGKEHLEKKITSDAVHLKHFLPLYAFTA